MLKLAAVFSDHMVLQRDKGIALWGETDGKTVCATIAGKQVKTDSKNGKFFLKLLPMEAGGPYTLTVVTESDRVSFTDVMIGEVWLAGGQSNMELELQNSFEGHKELKRSAKESIRYYQVPKYAFESEEATEAEEKSRWQKAGEETSGGWSAVGYYYAKEVSRKLGVTVGIIGCNWGGTSASAWISRELLEESKKTSSYVEEYDAVIEDQDFEEYLREREDYIAYQTEFEKNVSHYYETNEHPTWDEAIRLFGENKYPGPMGPYSEFRPAGLYEMMLSKVSPYTLKGFLYYQGEEDDHKPETYYELLSTLIRQWRTDWQDEALPFLLVQLPVFQNEGEPDYKNWPLIREAQMRAFQTIKNTGIAVILEQGEYGNIHPVKKEIVGKRLALQAFYSVYHLAREEEAFGPIYRDYYTEGNQIVLRFDHVGNGFVEGKDVTGFEVAGVDQKYYPAKYKIEKKQIRLSADEVERPCYARYCWTNYQKIGIFGGSGIPLAPFRTSREDSSRATGSRNSSQGVM